MNNATVKVVLVEDNPTDARLLRGFLLKAGSILFDLVHLEQLSEAIEYLSLNSCDIILLDLSLPDSHGLDTLREMAAIAPDIPIVVMTGLDDEATAIAALREGAQDYLVKGEISRNWLIHAIQYAIERQQILERLHHLNEELVRSNKELLRSNEDLAQFAYVVSHDLQQPLQSILSCAQTFARAYQGQLDEKADQYLMYMVNASLHMGQLIYDLLAYCRISESGQLKQLVDCNQVLQVVLKNLQAAIAESSAIITIASLPTVTGDEAHLIQLFQNLISNALKYRRKEEPPNVRVLAEQQQDEWLFGIEDNGIGIESDQCDRIFQIFQRLHSKQEYPGTGIGLAVCKKIVEFLGGRIWVDSKPGAGSTFYFTLPVIHDQVRLLPLG